MILDILTLVGALALFLYGMHVMIMQLQKLTANITPMFLPFMTSSNKFKSAFGGFGLTAAIQSSSATSVTVINYVNAGMMTLNQAAAVIMGANVGTTITAWMIALLMFTFDLAPYAYIVLAIGFILSTFKKYYKINTFGNLIISISLILMSLLYIQDSISVLLDNNIFSNLYLISEYGFLSVIIFILIGIVVSALIQSSSGCIILAIIMQTLGLLSFELAIAIVFGANIGTCITANLAAKDGNVRSRQAALIHFIFNLLVAIVLTILFRPFVAICSIIEAPYFGICLGHTLFNLIGTLIFIWFTDRLTSIIDKFAPVITKKEDFGLQHINRRFQGTPALSISQAFKEIVNFGNICYECFKYIGPAVKETDDDKFEEYRSKLVEYEAITDKMESGIASFLSNISKNELSPEQNTELKILYRVISELESLGDSGENISRILQRLRIHHITLEESALEKLNMMLYKLDQAYKIMNQNLRGIGTALFSIDDAYKAEEQINELRDIYRNEAVDSLEIIKDNYQSINYFLDLLTEFESMGDFMLNISQALDKQFN